jgi:putative transposase
LEIIKERCDPYNVKIIGYCLMDNHIHLVAVPKEATSLSKFVGYSHRLYSQRYNRRYKRSGHLWEGRYYSCPLDDAHFIRTLIYVDRNPVRAGLVQDAVDYSWSSAAAHLGATDAAGLVDSAEWCKISDSCNWEELIRQEETKETLSELRSHTISGQPLTGHKTNHR